MPFKLWNRCSASRRGPADLCLSEFLGILSSVDCPLVRFLLVVDLVWLGVVRSDSEKRSSVIGKDGDRMMQYFSGFSGPTRQPGGRTKILAFCAAIFMSLAAWSGTAVAQEDDENTTTYDFEDDLVTGDLVRPDGELLNVRKRGRRASLIRIREHFIPELLKSVENL